LRRQISNPLALGLLGLALAVTLWGYGYKLSLYGALRDHSVPRVPVAKLWIEHRFGFAAFPSSATAVKLKTRFHTYPDASQRYAAAAGICFPGKAGLLSITARPRVSPFFHAAIPLRSPPVIIFL
jgi:hypothetical protein